MVGCDGELVTCRGRGVWEYILDISDCRYGLKYNNRVLCHIP